MARNDALPHVLEPLRKWCLENLGMLPIRLTVMMHDGRKVQLPFPAAVMAQEAPIPEGEDYRPFEPNGFQRAILAALDGKALKAAALGAAVRDKGRLQQKDGLQALVERGMVLLHQRLGVYFRPDAPPPDWSSEDDED